MTPFEMESLDQLNISEQEFFMELRQEGVEHLGQVRLAIVEIDGDVSVYFFDRDESRPGLSVLPLAHRCDVSVAPVFALYACNRCGCTRELPSGQGMSCPRCQGRSWSRALTTRPPH
jgi:hypothetical protein